VRRLVNLFVGNRECPTRIAETTSAQLPPRRKNNRYEPPPLAVSFAAGEKSREAPCAALK